MIVLSDTAPLNDLILVEEAQVLPALVGWVSWADPNHMTFRTADDGPDAPGLSFA